MQPSAKPIRVLFVCLGNICRSPMAEAVFCRMVQQAELAGQIAADSAGTVPHHVGSAPHPGTQRMLRLRGITYDHIARRVTAADGQRFDYIILLEHSNMDEVRQLCKHTTAHIGLLLDFAPQSGLCDVPDPYYSGGFERVYELIEQGCRGLLKQIIADHAMTR